MSYVIFILIAARWKLKIAYQSPYRGGKGKSRTCDRIAVESAFACVSMLRPVAAFGEASAPPFFKNNIKALWPIAISLKIGASGGLGKFTNAVNV